MLRSGPAPNPVELPLEILIYKAAEPLVHVGPAQGQGPSVKIHVGAILPARVFRKYKKIRLPPHVPLWDIYIPDPKAFFVWTSLEGHTT